MKLREILVIFTLSVMVKGVWWVAAAEPILVFTGSVLTAFAIQAHRPEWIEMLGGSFFKKYDKTEPEPVAKEVEEKSSGGEEKSPEYSAEDKIKDEAELARLRKKYFVEEGLTSEERARLVKLYEKLEEPEDDEIQIPKST